MTGRQRLRRSSEFQEVRVQGGRRECGPFLLQIRILPSVDEAPLRRLGVIASRRIGNAVARNRAKRRLREVFRLNQACLPERCDVVLVARQAVLEMPFAELVERFCLNVAKLSHRAAS